VLNAPSEQTGSQPYKVAQANCPFPKRLIAAGGAIKFDAPPHVSLSGITPVELPDGGAVSSLTEAHENTFTTQSWDFIVAQAICVDAPNS
jgi:hypothetical protein